MSGLVLSLFPGIGLLDMAFEEEGFCVVRGPDLLWGGDVRNFRPPAGRFDGVIGGPPCQVFSRFRHINPHAGGHGNLIPEFERVVTEARPSWFLMENVEGAPEPLVFDYDSISQIVRDVWVGGETARLRRFSFGYPIGRLRGRFHIATHALHSIDEAPTVVAGHGSAFSHERGNMSIAEMCKLQGLPDGFLDGPDCPLTAHGKRKVIGNGVPLSMGRAVAKAVKAALRQKAEAA